MMEYETWQGQDLEKKAVETVSKAVGTGLPGITAPEAATAGDIFDQALNYIMKINKIMNGVNQIAKSPAIQTVMQLLQAGGGIGNLIRMKGPSSGAIGGKPGSMVPAKPQAPGMSIGNLLKMAQDIGPMMQQMAPLLQGMSNQTDRVAPGKIPGVSPSSVSPIQPGIPKGGPKK